MNSIKLTLVFQSLDTEVSERQRQQVVFARAVPSPVPHSPRVESGTHCQQLGGLGQFIVLHGFLPVHFAVQWFLHEAIRFLFVK